MIVTIDGNNGLLKRLLAERVSEALRMPLLHTDLLYQIVLADCLIRGIPIHARTNLDIKIFDSGQVSIDKRIYDESVLRSTSLLSDEKIKEITNLTNVKANINEAIRYYAEKREVVVEGDGVGLLLEDYNPLKVVVVATNGNSNNTHHLEVKPFIQGKGKVKEILAMGNNDEQEKPSTSNYCKGTCIVEVTMETLPQSAEYVVYNYYKKLSEEIDQNCIRIHSVRKSQNSIFCDVAIPHEYWKYFNTLPFLSYSYNFDVSLIPRQVSYMPFILVLMPIIWSTGLHLYIDDFDEVLYHSLNAIKEKFEDWYGVRLYGDIVCSNFTKLARNNVSTKMIYFSGGVDATASAYSLENQFQLALIMKGFDRPVEEMQSYMTDNFFESIFPLSDTKIIYSVSPNLHNINFTKLDEDFHVKGCGMSYWCCYAVGLYTFSNALVPAYFFHSTHVFLSSSYKNEQNVWYGASKIIVELLKTSFCQFVSHGDECSRLDKLSLIINRRATNKKNGNCNLRVCKNKGIPDNCCKCEKCARTIIGIYILGEDPNEYGFKVSMPIFIQWLKKNIEVLKFPCVEDWTEMIDVINHSPKLINDNTVNWLLQYDFAKINDINIQKSRLKKRTLNW